MHISSFFFLILFHCIYTHIPFLEDRKFPKHEKSKLLLKILIIGLYNTKIGVCLQIKCIWQQSSITYLYKYQNIRYVGYKLRIWDTSQVFLHRVYLYTCVELKTGLGLLSWQSWRFSKLPTRCTLMSCFSEYPGG